MGEEEKGQEGQVPVAPRKGRRKKKAAAARRPGRKSTKDQFVVMERLEAEEVVDLRVVAEGWTDEEGKTTPFKDKLDCIRWANAHSEGAKRYRIAAFKLVDTPDGPSYEFGIKEEHRVQRKIIG